MASASTLYYKISITFMLLLTVMSIKAQENRTEATSTSVSQNKNADIKIVYKNKYSEAEVSLHSLDDAFFIDLQGPAKIISDTLEDKVLDLEKELIETNAKHKAELSDSILKLTQEKETDIRNYIRYYRLAQESFYAENYKNALRLTNLLLDIEKSAEAYALKGTASFFMDDLKATEENWNEALKLDGNLTIPSIPELDNIIKKIKKRNNLE